MTSSTNFFEGKTILLTGASMGIGEATARVLARRAATLILVARSEDRLKKLCQDLTAMGATCRFVACDLTRPEDLQKLVNSVLSGEKLDGIIHNAGGIRYESFADSKDADFRSLFELNFFSILSLTRQLLPLLKKGTSPTLLLVSSAAAWRSLPLWSAYCASKAALSSWAEALRLELKNSGIRVVTVSPGVTQTDLSQHAATEGPKPFATTEGKGSSPELVAQKIVSAYQRGKRDEPVIFFNRLYRLLTFLFPKRFDRYFESHYRKRGWLP